MPHVGNDRSRDFTHRSQIDLVDLQSTPDRNGYYTAKTIRRISAFVDRSLQKELLKTATAGSAAVAEWYRYRTVACFVTGSSPVPLKDPPCRAAMHVKSVELKRPPVGVVW
ncbi:hypothetical protein TNCV_2417161 [Trichonephila clavipes]|nr:hypothetical protein TNCV_2417161 [Trichonephila clavipes]